MKAMVLAAGLGTRMAPLSRWRSKPVLPVLDEPLVLGLVRQLVDRGVSRLVVNAHPHAEQLREVLAKAPIPVDLSVEPELRGSGGGILQARPFLDGAEPFFVLNADMRADLDLRALLEAHARQGAIATLALRDDTRKHQFGSIGYAATGSVRRITERVDLGSETGSGLFTGVHVIEPELFEVMPERAEFSIVEDVYVPLLRAGGTLGTWLQPAHAEWSPVGTPRELLEANLEALRRAATASGAPADGVFVAGDACIEGELTGPVWIGAGAHVSRGAAVGPRVVMGAHAELPADARVRDALLLPGARPPGAPELERAIAFDAEVWRDA